MFWFDEQTCAVFMNICTETIAKSSTTDSAITWHNFCPHIGSQCTAILTWKPNRLEKCQKCQTFERYQTYKHVGEVLCHRNSQMNRFRNWYHGNSNSGTNLKGNLMHYQWFFGTVTQRLFREFALGYGSAFWILFPGRLDKDLSHNLLSSSNSTTSRFSGTLLT